MKRMLYWSVERNSNSVNYHFDKNEMLKDWGNAKHFLENVEKYDVVFYELETEITDELVLNLLNGIFSHCMLSNYRHAKLIDVNDY